MRSLGALAVACAVVAAAGGVVTTAAAHRDAGYLRPTGLTSQFDVGLVVAWDPAVQQVGHDGTVLEVAPSAEGAGAFVPGATARLVVDVFNNSTSLEASVQVALDSVDGGALADAVRVSGAVTYASGAQVTLFGTPEDPSESEVPLSGATGRTELLAPRGAPPLVPGAPWVPGAAGSSATVTLWWHLLDQPGADADGTSLSFVARIDGSSS